MAALAGLLVTTQAKADPDLNYNLSFALTNGGTFTGTVDFSSNFQSITSLSGIMTGYQDGTLGYDKSDPTGTDVFSATSNGLYTNIGGTKDITVVLEDTPWSVPIMVFGHKIGSIPEENVITLAFNVNNPPDITLATSGLLGTLTEIAGTTGPTEQVHLDPTPEPGTLLLLGSGLVGLAGIVRRKIGMRA